MRSAVFSRSFSAFRASRQQPYLAYASLRLGSPQAGRTVVHHAFADLEVQWHRALRGESPAATAWGLLTARTNAAAVARGQLHALLPGDQADGVLLLRLGLSPEETAGLMGVPVNRLRASMSAARRTLRTAGHAVDICTG